MATQEVRLTPTANHYTNSTAPGTVRTLSNLNHMSTQLRTFLRFAMATPPTNGVLISAVLQLHTSTGTADSPGTATAVLVPENIVPVAPATAVPWTESNLTWTNQPGGGGVVPTGTVLGTVPAPGLVGVDRDVNITLDPNTLDARAGTDITIAVAVDDIDSWQVWSTRYTTIPANAPELILTYDIVVPAPSGSFLTFPAVATADTLATAPTIVRTQQVTTTLPGAPAVIPADDPRFHHSGGGGYAFSPVSVTAYGPNNRYAYGWGSFSFGRVSFKHTGTEFELRLYQTDATYGSLRIKVDGKRVTDLPVITGMTGGGRHVEKVTFATSATRLITLEMGYLFFAGLFVGAGNTIAAPDASVDSVRVSFQGDSITNGNSATTGLINGTWPLKLANYIGAPGVVDPWNVAIGSTGYTNPGTSVNLQTRLTDQTNWAPNVCIVWAGYNDMSTAPATNAATARTYWQGLKSGLPAAEIFIGGVWCPRATPLASWSAMDLALQQAAQAEGLRFVSPITGNCYAANGALLGSTGPWVRDAADVAAFIQGDAVHPTDAGNARIAAMWRAALIILTSTAPAGANTTVTITDRIGLGDLGPQEIVESAEVQTDSLGLRDSVLIGRNGAASLPVTVATAAAGFVGQPGGTANLAVTVARPAAGVLGGGNQGRLAVTATLAADGRVKYQRAQAPLTITASLPARGEVTVSAATEPLTNRWYDMLPRMYRAADDMDTSTARGRPLWQFMDAILASLEVPETIAARIAAGQLTDPARADDAWVGWLAQAVGVAGVGVPQQRQRLAALAASPALGSNAYMVALISPYLTGSRSVEVESSPPWTITIRVLSSELGSVGGTPEGLRDTLYATGRIPAGFLLNVTTAGQTWAEIDAVMPTWQPGEGLPWSDIDAIGL